MDHDSTAALERPAYPRDQWYVAALSHEVGDGLLARTLLDVPMVLYRNRAGRAIAMHGACPHRGFPLGSGTRVAGGLRCNYHGLTFDDAGTCAAVAQSTAKLRTYVLIEEPPLIWIWLSDAGTPPAGRFPATTDLGFGRDEWRIDDCGYLNVAARYRFLCENLLDTAHIAYVHDATLDRAPLRFHATRSPAGSPGVSHSRESRANDAAAFAFLLPEAGGSIDVVLTAELRSPGLIVAVASDFYRAATPHAPRSPLGTMVFVHALTPEHANATHYFPLFARNFRITDEAFSRVMVARNAEVTAEDRAAVETLERFAGRFPSSAGELALPDDALALRARTIISALVAAEAR